MASSPSALRLSSPFSSPSFLRASQYELCNSFGFLNVASETSRALQCHNGMAASFSEDATRRSVCARCVTPAYTTTRHDGSSSLGYASWDTNNAAQIRTLDDESNVLIECRDVYKSFGEKHILKGASFKVRHGEAVGIIGPSGTGKSTILRIMAGLLEPDQGEVYICGKKRNGLISDEGMLGLRIGLVFQSAALFDSLSVRENVGFMLYEHSSLSKERISELVAESLAAVGLKGVEDRFPSELSGGMKKRVALARAIISDDRQDHNEPEVWYET